ncbi:hypothetical protein Fmac_000044 [Flemingia macrophylla]|uniref:Uncharacterized protein n=1 Tax=Flemingia macrophylla TaxID=520843 RepID=A0ABD1ND51_9FABA
MYLLVNPIIRALTRRHAALVTISRDISVLKKEVKTVHAKSQMQTSYQVIKYQRNLRRRAIKPRLLWMCHTLIIKELRMCVQLCMQAAFRDNYQHMPLGQSINILLTKAHALKILRR